MGAIANTPQPPYYAVIFTSEMSDGENRGYGKMGDKMVELASKQPGFLGVESVRGTDGVGITVSYWESLEAIKAWKENSLHRVAQDKGKSEWYAKFGLRVSKVERDDFMNM
ncbi:antibiotic biosynthesis monooxygenase family protein [Paenibacillus sp. PSB04]|uniref:antibiotic biosynthesis monooxygenase family protein n=1 Tax=Paenibacillus sp. PSB04 TaxID=2866810 RepID=UPI0021F19809|nr:antibiotic biosynthesis monooxygenase [Paenibacillus sp. PSB04]UYO02887.1 antibiotic biosynthesis monooxygenase [Paenibacillus sp. PSB04]